MVILLVSFEERVKLVAFSVAILSIFVLFVVSQNDNGNVSLFSGPIVGAYCGKSYCVIKSKEVVDDNLFVKKSNLDNSTVAYLSKFSNNKNSKNKNNLNNKSKNSENSKDFIGNGYGSKSKENMSPTIACRGESVNNNYYCNDVRVLYDKNEFG